MFIYICYAGDACDFWKSTQEQINANTAKSGLALAKQMLAPSVSLA